MELVAEDVPGILTYNPHAVQKTFHAARTKHRRRWFVAGIQGGKTEAGAFEAALFAMRFRPGGKGAIFGPDYPKAIEARDRFNAMVPYEQRTWNGSERVWKVRAENGALSTVYWRSMHDPNAPRGLVLDWMWLDECAMYTAEGWNNLRTRVAVKRGHTWGSTTPVGRNWLWRQAVKDAEADDYLIHCRSIDNPMFPLSEWEALEQRHGAESPYFLQEHEAQFVAFVGQAIPQFSRKQIGDYPYDPNLPLYKLWDFGFWPAPTVCTFMQRHPDDFVSLLGCKVWYQTERDEILSEDSIKDVPQRFADADYIDPSGKVGARASGDKGWLYAMKSQGRKVSFTRKVGEAEGLNLIRTHCKLDQIGIHGDGEGAEILIDAFETGELNKNIEEDKLADQHPQADVLDSVRYGFANLFGGGPAPRTWIQ